MVDRITKAISPLHYDEEKAASSVTTPLVDGAASLSSSQQRNNNYNSTATTTVSPPHHHRRVVVHLSMNADNDDQVEEGSRNNNKTKEEDHDTIYDEHSDGIATTKFLGRVLLLITAFLYGTLNVTLRLVYALPDPPSASALSCTRGWLATLCFAPLLLRRRRRRRQTTTDSTPLLSVSETKNGSHHHQHRRSLLFLAAELAFWNFGAQGLANLGLLTVTSARAAFLTQTSVVMTPVVSFLAGHAVHQTAWIACAVAMLGLVMLSYDTKTGFGHFGAGDLLCLGGALSWSTYIFRLSICQGYDEINLQAIKTFFLAILYTIWFGAASIESDIGLWLGYTNLVAWALLFYSALGPGTVADVIQNRGQLTVSAAEGNVILSTEPVFTALFGLFFLRETLSWQEVIGGGLIITAALVATR